MDLTSFLPLLAELLVKSAAILSAAALVHLALRRASAAQRHGIWLAAFAALLLLPATRLVAPRWNLARAQPAVVHVRIADSPVSIRTSEPDFAPTAAVSTPLPPRAQPSWFASFDWSAFAINLWLVGVVALLGRRALGGLRLRWMLRASSAANDAHLEQARRIAGEFSVTRSITLRVSKNCRVPLTWGWWRPVLMLPEDYDAWPEDRLLAALRHELAHIRRGDFAVRLMGDVVRAFYWPNPLVWFASRALRIAQEQACDDLVLGAGTSPTGYASLLCEVARGLNAPSVAMAMAQASTLETRVRAIVDVTRNRRPAGWRAAVIGVVSVVLTLMVSATAQLRAAESASSDSAPQEPTEAIAQAQAKADNANSKVTIGKGRKATYDAKTGDLVSTSGAAGDAVPRPVPGMAEQAPQIMIEAKFVEFTGERAEADAQLAALGLKMKLGSPVVEVAKEASMQAIEKALQAKAGVNLLSAPRVTTKSGQQAVIEIGNELRYATAWEEGTAPDTWKPTAFDTRHYGFTFEATPTIRDESTLEIDIVSSVVKLLGFKEVDTDKPVPAPTGAPEAEGPRRVPVFSTRKITTSISLKPGGTAAIGFMQEGDINPLTQEKFKREGVMFVTASIITEKGEAVKPAAAPSEKDGGAAAPAPEAATKKNTLPAPEAWKLPVEVNAANTRMEGGVMVAEGNVRLKYGAAAMTADSLRYDAASHRAELRGNVEIKTADSTVRGETMSVEFTENGQVLVGGNAEASTTFLDAYMTFQRGEKAEASGNIDAGIEALNHSMSLLDQVVQRWPAWNPEIVKHRRDRAVEALGRLRAKGSGGPPNAEKDLQGESKTAEPVEPAAKPTKPSTAPAPQHPQIEIEARFVEVTPGKANAVDAVGKPAPASPERFPRVGDKRAVDTLLFGNVFEGGGAVFQDFIADARKKKNGVDVLSAPKVTTKIGQRAVIEIIRERRYATEWKEGTKPGKWKPTAFETRNCGTTLEVEPTLLADGTIALDLIPQVVDFLGFENLDTGKPMPLGTDDSVAQGWSTSSKGPPIPQPGADDAAPEGPRLKAVFSDFQLKTKLVLKSGETVMLEPLEQIEDVKPLGERVRKTKPVVFITASIFVPRQPTPADFVPPAPKRADK